MLGHHNDPHHDHHDHQMAIMRGDHEEHRHGGHPQTEHLHTHGTPSSEAPGSRFCWQVHHPFENIPGRAAIEVGPWSGLLPRWRFVVPADYEGVVRWGIGPPNGAVADPTQISLENVRRPLRHGPVQLTDGPLVEWFGGHNPLSPNLSAYIVIDGDPPHYLAFGQADEPEGPPTVLEGIYFAAHHSPHPH